MKRLIAIATLALLAAPAAWAGQPQVYTPAAMATAQAADKPVVLHVTARWCSTCAAQMPIVLALLKDPKYKDVVLLDIDFDSQKALLRQFDVRAQSTFVAFKGRQEVGRSTGETDRASIEKLFDKTS